MGIGPEVTLSALRSMDADDIVLIGRRSAVEAANEKIGASIFAIEQLSDDVTGGIALLEPPSSAEPVEVAAIRMATEACLDGRAAALVTGPINKAKLVQRGFAFRGHTDFLGHLCNAPREVMAFVGGELRVALVTTHIPLMEVATHLTQTDIVRVVEVTTRALSRDLGISEPRVVVCGLNPHAGEDGLLGSEEQRIIGPACDRLRGRGFSVEGPVSAETAFLMARLNQTDVVIAMYHDQGLAPLKAVDFGRSVNWTLGLPIIRTSVDHGTAETLVGTGSADDSSMRAAIQLARSIVSRRRESDT